MKIKNLDYHEDRWESGNYSKEELIAFEDDIISHWENGEITGPIHLSNANEEQLIEVFKFQKELVNLQHNGLLKRVLELKQLDMLLVWKKFQRMSYMHLLIFLNKNLKIQFSILKQK